ncbi:MAG: lysoplasmalogenase [Chitinophagaceae bacterium]|jgi:uncharacterized membrane protein YhhN
MKSFFQKFGITIYILLLSAHLYAQVLGEKFATIQFITKALLLPTLILFLACQDHSESTPKGKWLVIIGLFGSFLGDVLLTNEKYFIAGMIAFMTTHICNIIFFNGIKPAADKKIYKVYAVAALFLLFCFGIYKQLAPSMGNLIYPILVYMLLICLSALKAFRSSLNEQTNLIAQLFWFPGMLFFITSDAVLAFNKFQWSIHTPIPHIGLVTMMTYGVAQLLLTKGFQLYFKK